ncbi:MAG: SIR2 family protein [Armatimonadota bacterium]
MLIKELDFPLSVINAQAEGRLVIFAGSGISVPKPSSLPDFKDLVVKVAANKITQYRNEPFDYFLGRCEQEGILVHQRVKEILSDVNSKPNKMHNAIISLFGSSENVRIVTTNMDRHLSTILKEHFNDVEIYYAPALPIGRNFSGLIYLHGSIDRDADRIVVTDSDFGKAYVTEGWATQFLKELFTNPDFVVLFIGYSHNDPLVRYLARGLISGTQRYAITLPGREEHWKLLKIQPITYLKKKGGRNSHRCVENSLSAWADRIKCDWLGHERRIKVILQKEPDIIGEDSDYIEEAINHPIRIQYFVKYADSVQWLKWAESKGAFDQLFITSDSISDNSKIISRWFADKYVIDYSDEALELIVKHGMKMHYALWQCISSSIYYRYSNISPDLMLRWIEVLIYTRPYRI